MIRKTQYLFLPLFISGLGGIPVYFFGRSASGGIFPVDVICVAMIIKLGIRYGHLLIRRAVESRIFFPFLLLTLWAT
ncbi:MAG: hypothetical protein ACFFAE_22865, partial [Candidatus Hodarchaeota archaeon]